MGSWLVARCKLQVTERSTLEACGQLLQVELEVLLKR
jgi:hypothetical protein